MLTTTWKTVPLAAVLFLAAPLVEAGGRAGAGFAAIETRGPLTDLRRPGFRGRARVEGVFAFGPAAIGVEPSAPAGEWPFVHGGLVQPGFFRPRNGFPYRSPAVQRGYFGRRPRFFRTVPTPVRVYLPYFPDIRYGDPAGATDRRHGADGRAEVYRGEGRGATLYDPSQDGGTPRDDRAGRTTSRGIAQPPVTHALEENPVGVPFTWTDPHSGARSTVTPIRDVGGEKRCREFRHSVAEPSGELHAVGVACRTSQGIWELIL